MKSTPMPQNTYALIDCGGGRKLEQFGDFLIDRPAGQAVWQPKSPSKTWKKAHARLDREGESHWTGREALPETWQATIEGIRFKLKLTDFGHIGVFPEQMPFWKWIRETVSKCREERPFSFLNLFAYSGGASCAAAQGGAEVCHVDASRGMVAWARENAELNALENSPIRWIVDDAIKFLQREEKRGKRYDGIILDPPSFGRGAKGEVFKLEEHLPRLLQLCTALLSETPTFFLLSCHTPGYTPIVLQQILQEVLQRTDGEFEAGEMWIEADSGVKLPSGAYSRWQSRGISC